MSRFVDYDRPKVLARLQTLDQLEALFGAHGLAVRHVAEVREESHPFAEHADWIERMRHADSFLTALTDAEVAEGVRLLRAQPDRLSHTELSLVVLGRRAVAQTGRSP